MKDKEYLKIRSKPKYFLFLCLYYFLMPLCKMLYGKKNNWLICERGTDAQDNGFFFFKYLCEHHPDINAVFLIKRNSPDYLKVKQIGKVVEFGSFKHLMMVIGFPVKISSHLFGYAPWIQLATYYRRKKDKCYHAFLQHGITKNFQAGFLKQNCKSLKLFVCGAKPEYEYIKKEFGYSDAEVCYTGFSRYDNLNSFVCKNQILFMPTWRRYLDNVSNEEFLRSKFYIEWSSLLQNKELIKKCEEYDLKIKFYLHNSLQKYFPLFRNNHIVEVVPFDKENVQDLLKESKMLVTDFSSVYYDFAYMKKPTVYFQFDEEDYYKGHYDKGYFDYRRDGYGKVCVNSQDAIEAILNIISSNFLLDEEYLNRIDNTFSFRDDENSSRIMSKIINSTR